MDYIYIWMINASGTLSLIFVVLAFLIAQYPETLGVLYGPYGMLDSSLILELLFTFFLNQRFGSLGLYGLGPVWGRQLWVQRVLTCRAQSSRGSRRDPRPRSPTS